jgi:2-hydroxy-6-oxo-6-(2'-carboxyphenyl)-hexa-2,4-dienoate hydrolase
VRSLAEEGARGMESVHDRLDGEWVRTLDLSGIRTRVYEAGVGPPLLLIHGGQFGSLYSLDCWSLVLGPLAQHFRVIAFDKLGQGHTDPPRRSEDYVVEAVQAHIDALIDTLELDDFHVLGHSRGGVPALRLAVEQHQRVRSLVLADSGSAAPFDPAIPVGAFYANLEPVDGDRAPSRRDVTREPLAQAIDPRWITDDFVERMLAIASLPAQQATRAALRAVEDAVWRPSLAASRAWGLGAIDAGRLASPTLVLWGYEDRSAPRHQGLRLYERIAATTRDAEFVILNRAGHYVFRDRPAAFVDVVSRFCLRYGPESQS